MERWQKIPKHENYEASDSGEIRNARTLRKLSLRLDYYGYLVTDLSDTTYKVHRLVASAFIGEPGPKIQVNHIDGDKTNNHISNLEYVTNQENSQHAADTGLSQRGEDRSNLTEDQVREARRLYKSGRWKLKSLANRYGLSQEAVRLLIKGVTWSWLK